MKNRASKGFTTLEALLILIILGIIGYVGWYVYHAKNNADNTYNAASQASSSSKPATSNKSNVAKSVMAKGSIAGKLGYPSESLPDQKVCAALVSDAASVQCFDKPLTGVDGQSYKIDVAPGIYYVYAQLDSQSGSVTTDYKAYYNQFVVCGESVDCPDAGHTQYVKVTVTAGQTTDNVDPIDWYNI